MAIGRSGVPRQLRTLFSLGTAAALTDGELLERFTTRRDASAEAAFATLVERHGPVVLRVCRDVLHDRDDADDAFQATFLVLVRRAHSIRNRDSVASWLYGVALRVAACSRASASRRRRHERKAARGPLSDDGEFAGQGDDLAPSLHEEVGRLPEKYRAAVILCYWQGLTHEQAAARLRWPVGTVRSRLSWARQRLRIRLTRRGLAPSVVLPCAAISASTPTVAAPAALVERTIQSALQLALGQTPPGVVSASAWALTEGVIRTMMIAKWKIAAFAVLTAGLTTAGAGGLAQQEPAPDPQRSSVSTKEEPPGVVSPDRESPLDLQIDRLKAYRQVVQAKVEETQKTWLALAKNGLDFTSIREKKKGIEFEEYKQVRERLFKINLDLMEARDLLTMRQAEIAAREPGVDPETLLTKRVDDALHKDPEVLALLPQVEQARKRVGEIAHQIRVKADPARRTVEQTASKLENEYFALLDRKREELMAHFREQYSDSQAAALRELSSQIKTLEVRKKSYAEILRMHETVIMQPDPETVKITLISENLATLRDMMESVNQRIEQLELAAKASRKP